TCIGTFIAIKLILSALMIVAVLIAILIWKVPLHHQFDSTEHEFVIYIFILFFVLDGLSQIALSTFAARMESAKQQLPGLIGVTVRTSGMIIVALAWRNIYALVGAYILGNIAILAASLFLFSGYGIGRPSKEYFRSYYRFALPIMLISVLGVLQVNIDKVMIQFFWGTLAVGYYFGAQRVVESLDILSQSVGMLFIPAVSSLSSQKAFEQIRNLTRIYERYVSMLVVPAAVFLAVFPEQLIHISLGDDFLSAVPVFRLLALFMVLNSLSRPYSIQIYGMNHPGLGAKIGIVSTLTNIILNLVLIPNVLFGVKLAGLGIVGAATATVISGVVSNILLRIAAYRLTGTRQNWRLLYHFLAASIMGLILYYISVELTILWYHLFALGVIGLSIYLGILWLCKEFTRSDLTFFRDLASTAKMKDYLASELGNKSNNGDGDLH
ncbi:flippase, partial [Chloroflexota bacterium]